MLRSCGCGDLDWPEHGIRIGGDDAAVGELFADEDGIERASEEVLYSSLAAGPWGVNKRGRATGGRCWRDPEVAIVVAGVEIMIQGRSSAGAWVDGVNDDVGQFFRRARGGQALAGILRARDFLLLRSFKFGLEIERQLRIRGDDGDVN